MFTLPFFCLVLDICPYGMDKLLFGTHILHLFGQFAYSAYHREWDRVVIAMQVCSICCLLICLSKSHKLVLNNLLMLLLRHFFPYVSTDFLVCNMHAHVQTSLQKGGCTV